MGRISTKVSKVFDNDKFGRRLASNFERLSRVAGLKVERFDWDDRVIVTTYDEIEYKEGDYEG